MSKRVCVICGKEGGITIETRKELNGESEIKCYECLKKELKGSYVSRDDIIKEYKQAVRKLKGR